MFTQTFQIGGYSPAVPQETAGKVQEQMAVVDGRNFMWSINGVFSAFGHELASPPVPGPMLHPHVATIEGQVFILTATGAFTYAGGVITEYMTWTAEQTHPEFDLTAYDWTQAYVGSRFWFSHPTISHLIYYDLHDGEWGLFRDDCWNCPIFGITQADNRLVVLLRDVVIWSRFDRGDLWGCGDFPNPLPQPENPDDPESVAEWQARWNLADWRCGSGAQSLLLIKRGQPYTVAPYNGGFLTFTSAGIMVSAPENSQSQDPDMTRLVVGALVFQHQPTTFDNPAYGPCAVASVDDKQVIWISTTGLWQFAGTQGGGFGAVQPWQAEFGQFYTDLFRHGWLRDEDRLDAFKMRYVQDAGLITISSRSAPDVIGYDRAHVHQMLLDKWGSFDHAHLALGEGTEARGKTASQSGQPLDFVFVTPSLRVAEVTHARGPNSWVRFSPIRLQLPTEDLPPSTMSSVQEVRIGHSGPQTEARWPAQLASSWRVAQHDTLPRTTCRIMLSGGDDAETQTVDEGEYGWLTSTDRQTSTYALHVTGITHSLIVTALGDDEYFNIRHIELGFFWAGVK